MTVQDTYTATIAKTQETWAGLVESMTANMKLAFGDTDSPLQNVDPNAAIDQLFDFWEKALTAQREAAHQLVTATVTAGEKVRAQAESVGTSLNERIESFQKAVTETKATK